MLSNDRFTLQQLTPTEWIIVDANCDPGDPSRTVACVYEADQYQYGAVWLRDLGLPMTWTSPHDVLRGIRQNSEHPTHVPSRKPIPIPHRRPLRNESA
ncbi:hypothetical protein [Humibacter albus]|jgi:hypothetical protein|uniref:hypothetical protein n=1 Tax=Humibacter albus TaxID=427754 RepID=UPI0003B68114|nr:hypothetical protein [Humibacter albus]